MGWARGRGGGGGSELLWIWRLFVGGVAATKLLDSGSYVVVGVCILLFFVCVVTVDICLVAEEEIVK